MQLDNLLQELKTHEQVGDAALSKTRYIYEDLPTVLGELAGIKAKNETYQTAEDEVKRDVIVIAYQGRIVVARDKDIDDLDSSYSPQLKTLGKEMTRLGNQMIEYQTQQPESENGIRNRYSGRFTILNTYIGQEKNRKDRAQTDALRKIAKIELTPLEEDAFRRLNEQVEKATESITSEIAKTTDVNKKDVGAFERPYKDSPEFLKLQGKVRRKDNILSGLKTQLEPIEEKIREHRAEFEGKEREMYNEISTLNESVQTVLTENSERIEKLKGDHSELDVTYTGHIRNVEADAIYLEEEVNRRFSELYRIKIATKAIEDHKKSHDQTPNSPTSD